MSMATTTGGGFSMGGAGGGLTMAQAHHANAVARPAPPQRPNTTSASGGAAAPPSVAALGADLLDKDQALSLKQVRNLSHLPIVAVDLFGSEVQVANFPPKPYQETRPKSSGTLQSLSLCPTEASHKALRKWLTKSRGYEAVRDAALSTKGEGVEMHRPQILLGNRRVKDIPHHVREAYHTVDETSTPAIAEEPLSGSVGVAVANSTMDGGTPSGDDYDRVVFKLRLHESKKAVTVLPEEAVGLLLTEAKYKVAKTFKSEDEEEILEYPIALSVPTWACNDSSVDALLDGAGATSVVYQRNVAACAGSLIPGPEGSPNLLLNKLRQVLAKKQKELQKRQSEDSPQAGDDALLVMVGLSCDGIECTAIHVSSLQPSCPSCLFGNFKVLTSVSYRHEAPLSKLENCIKQVKSLLASLAPELEVPSAFVMHGTLSEQKEAKSKLEALKLTTWEKIPIFSTDPNCVAIGTAVLGAVTHGRLVTHVEGENRKALSQRAVRVQNVAPTAVGIRLNYNGGASNKWTPVKVVFDFDRRVPAGPHLVELSAAECAAHVNASSVQLSPEEAAEASKHYEGSKCIPAREEAALNFRLQIIQKLDRDGEWTHVGDPMRPLSKMDDEEEEKYHACESAVLELSLGPCGIITASLVGDGKSVVQAMKSARNSKLRYYAAILLAVAFFGGFLIKSYWEERVFERDTERVLAYYRNVVPGGFQDGDRQNARYLVWKYRGRKAKLWKRLETKYGAPVLHAHEWEEDEAPEEDMDNLDEVSGAYNESDASSKHDEEQDL